MARFVKGDVVVVPFPFSDLSQTKRRPALVLAALDGDDVVLCMITSRGVRDRYAVGLIAEDFETGALPVDSNIRPTRLFTADSATIVSLVGRLQFEKMNEVRDVLLSIL